MMNFKRSMAFMALSAVLFYGCPYNSPVPISQPTEKINKKLLGNWVEAKNASKPNADFFEIKKLGKTQYEIVQHDYNSSDSTYTQKSYIAHLTTIGDNVFLNLHSDSKYHLHKIDLQGESFTLHEITDNIDEKFSDSKALHDFVSKHMNLSFFYNKEEKTYIQR